MKDPYEILGVDRNTAPDEIKKVYKKLAMKYHPDKNKDDPNAEEKFKEISAAYDKITNPDKHFEQFRSNYNQHFHQPPPEDLVLEIRVSIEDVFYGKTRQIRYAARSKCNTCDGVGTTEKHNVSTCGFCGGSGVLQQNNGFFAHHVMCPQCKGKRQTYNNPCSDCRGQPLFKSRMLDIDIPKNTVNGSHIIHSGKGHWSEVGYGNLVLVLSILPHDKFMMYGNDLHCNIDCDYSTLCLGGSVNVSIFDTELAIKINKGTKIGSQIRLKGRGLNNGDIIGKINCIIPDNLSDDQIELLEKLRNNPLEINNDK